MRRACHDTKYEYAAQSAKSAEECKQVLSYPSLFGFSDVVGLAGKDGRIVPVFVLTLPPALMIIPTRHGDGDSSFRSTVKAALKKPTDQLQPSKPKRSADGPDPSHHPAGGKLPGNYSESAHHCPQ